MSLHILEPTEIEACGNIAKIIKEFVGLLNTKNENISIAKMESPGGWEEPGQSPEFDEYTLVLRGMLRVQTRLETFDVKAGEGFISQKGEWIKYSTPESEGAEYIAVCQPAFSPDTVHRDE
jgi:mannose-6-phosphate isomerase-like protein (cupin superfamily)